MNHPQLFKPLVTTWMRCSDRLAEVADSRSDWQAALNYLNRSIEAMLPPAHDGEAWYQLRLVEAYSKRGDLLMRDGSMLCLREAIQSFDEAIRWSKSGLPDQGGAFSEVERRKSA